MSQTWDLIAPAKLILQRTARRRLTPIPAGRFDAKEEFGAACACLCGTQAGYITG